MIWCVEDDASIRDIEVYALTSTGFEARGYEDGTSFWQALQHEKPELVVLDVMLPGIDGIELLKRMKADDAGTKTFRCLVVFFHQGKLLLQIQIGGAAHHPGRHGHGQGRGV